MSFNPDIIWPAWMLLFAVFEGFALYNKKAGDTLSERTQAWFHTYTIPGRIFFGIIWFWFSVWFLIHILWR